jgi:hypothetical protein
MKVAELVLALEELGTIYRHSSKNEPKPCISQVLQLLKGNEQFTLVELRAKLTEKKNASGNSGKATASKVSKAFAQAEHLNRLLDAKSEASFAAAIETVQKAKPTNEALESLLAAYTGIAQRKGRKKKELYDTFVRAFKAEQRLDARAQFSAKNLPI